MSYVLYFGVGLIVAACMFPWLRRLFAHDDPGPVESFAFLFIGPAIVWPLMLVVYVGTVIERRAKARRRGAAL